MIKKIAHFAELLLAWEALKNLVRPSGYLVQNSDFLVAFAFIYLFSCLNQSA